MQLHLISWYVNAVNNVEPKRKSWRGEGSKRCFQNKLRRLPVGKLADEILFTDAAMSPLSYQWWFCSLVTHDLVPPVFIFPNHSFHSHLLIKQQLESLSSTWYTNRGKSKHFTFENRNLCVKAVTISYYWSRPKFHGCYSIFSLWSSLSHTTIFCCTALERYIYIYIMFPEVTKSFFPRLIDRCRIEGRPCPVPVGQFGSTLVGCFFNFVYRLFFVLWPSVPQQCCCDTLFHLMTTWIMKSIVRHLCIMWSDEVILSPSDRYMQIQRKALSYRQLDNLGWLWSYDFSPRSTLLFVKFFSHHREASSDTIHLFLIFLSPCVTLGLHLNDVNEWHMAVYLYHTREYILVRYVSKYLCNALTLTVDT